MRANGCVVVFFLETAPSVMEMYSGPATYHPVRKNRASAVAQDETAGDVKVASETLNEFVMFLAERERRKIFVGGMAG